jgi:ribosomal protein S18 acetylase RimI-like enzyme
MIQIRKAHEGDASYLAEMNHAFNGVKRSSDDIRHCLRRTGSTETVLVAEEVGAVVGFACIQVVHSFCYDSPSAEITELYVTPEYRRRGAGSALVREAISYARQAGASEILLRTNVKNEAAQALFTQVGIKIASDIVFHSVIAE